MLARCPSFHNYIFQYNNSLVELWLIEIHVITAVKEKTDIWLHVLPEEVLRSGIRNQSPLKKYFAPSMRKSQNISKNDSFLSLLRLGERHS